MLDRRRGAPARLGPVAEALLWGLAYVVALLAGRLLALEGASLSLVWPACGVAALALLGVRGRALLHRLALLGLLVLVVDVATGMAVPLALVVAAVNLGQALVGSRLLLRDCPELWGAGGGATFDSVRRVGAACVAAAVSSLVAVLGAVAGRAVLGEPLPLVELGMLWVRNSYGFLAVVTVAHLTTHAWRFGAPPARAGRVEGLAMLVVGSVVWVATFWQDSLPVAFVPSAVTIWVALRLPSVRVAWYGAGAAAVVLSASALGRGPSLRSRGPSSAERSPRPWSPWSSSRGWRWPPAGRTRTANGAGQTRSGTAPPTRPA